jgi:hypothetical protein
MHPPTAYLVYDGERVSSGGICRKMQLAADENFRECRRQSAFPIVGLISATFERNPDNSSGLVTVGGGASLDKASDVHQLAHGAPHLGAVISWEMNMHGEARVPVPVARHVNSLRSGLGADVRRQIHAIKLNRPVFSYDGGVPDVRRATGCDQEPIVSLLDRALRGSDSEIPERSRRSGDDRIDSGDSLAQVSVARWRSEVGWN